MDFKHIVYMKHNIKKGNALINYRKGVSVELGRHDDPKSLFFLWIKGSSCIIKSRI